MKFAILLIFVMFIIICSFTISMISDNSVFDFQQREIQSWKVIAEEEGKQLGKYNKRFADFIAELNNSRRDMIKANRMLQECHNPNL